MSIDVHFLRRILRLIAAESELRLQFLSVTFNASAVKFCFFILVISEAPARWADTNVRDKGGRGRDEKADFLRYEDEF